MGDAGEGDEARCDIVCMGVARVGLEWRVSSISRNSSLAFPMSLSALTSSPLAALSSYSDARCADGSLKSVPHASADEALSVGGLYSTRSTLWSLKPDLVLM